MCIYDLIADYNLILQSFANFRFVSIMNIDPIRKRTSSLGRYSRTWRSKSVGQSSNDDHQQTPQTSSTSSGSSDTSPTSQFFKFLTPKLPSFKRKRNRFHSDKSERSNSADSPPYPLLSSQCLENGVEPNVSPIKSPPAYYWSFMQCPIPSCTSFSPTGDTRFDFGSLDEEKIVPSFLSSRTCYNAMPKSGKVIVLSTELLVKNAFSCLVTNEIRAAPLWESSTQTFIGMLTITDFINVLRHYYYSSKEDIKSIENQKILTWRKITNVSKPIVQIHPNNNLVEASKLLLQERIHRLPVYDEKRNSVLFVITRKRLLQYLHKNLLEKLGPACMKAPSFMMKTIGELRPQIGTWENIAMVSLNTKVIDALDLFCAKNVSALPVLDEENKLVDIFAKFDVFALAKEQTYDNLDMTVSEALDKAEVHEDVYGCTLDESLRTVIDRLVAAKVHRLVVVDERQAVIGMLSLSDVLKFLVLQPLDESGITSDTIDEAPEGAIGGFDDSSVFLDSGTKPSTNFKQSSSLEKQDSSDLSEEFVKLQVESGTPEQLSEASVSEN